MFIGNVKKMNSISLEKIIRMYIHIHSNINKFARSIKFLLKCPFVFHVRTAK